MKLLKTSSFRLLTAICLSIALFISTYSLAQSAGEVMFVGYNGEGGDGLSFVTLVPLPPNTTIYFNDNEWNGAAFNDNTEGALTWTNDTGNYISAGTVVTIESANNNPTVNLGSVIESEGGFNVSLTTDVIYMFIGSDDYTPTTFLSAIANNGFSAGNGPLTSTGLTAGVNAINITGSEDVMVYSGSTVCTTSIANCAASIATVGNWSTQDTGGDDSNNGFPDFPDDVPINIYGTVFEGITYYSRNATSGGNWDDPNSWTTFSDGSGGPLGAGIWPGGADNVVILPGHTITIDAVTDDQASGISANGLNRSPNVSPFDGSADQMFYHTGDVIIGGTLNSTEETILEGYTLISDGGTFDMDEDLVILGYFEVSSGANFDFLDDLILSGNSSTVINATITGSDDIYLDWTDATLCGDGIANLGNGGPDPDIQYFNGAGPSQICSTFTSTCTSNCGTFDDGSPSGNFFVGNTGPGGVGNLNNNQLWLRADDLILNDGDPVTTWTGASGNALVANSSGVGAEEPTFNANSVNGFPSVYFDGGDYLAINDPSSLDLIPGSNNDVWSFFIVYNVPDDGINEPEQGTLFSKATSNGGTRQYQYTIDDTGGTSRFTSYIGGNNTVGNVVATNDWFVSSHSNDNANPTAEKYSWTNEAVNFNAGAGVGTGTVPGTDVLIGARRATAPNTGFGYPITGDIAEIAMYDQLVNEAQRIIIDNYLAAKYDITLSANEVYDMDDNGNGDYDFEVAGIGQAADGSNHRDAKGSGLIRIWNPSDLDDSEFLMWGHDNGSFDGITSDVDGTLIEERLERVWRVAETGDVGLVNVSIELSQQTGNPFGSELSLLIDRNGNGFADNDVTPVFGAYSAARDLIIFSNIDFQDGDRFTLGNSNILFPLPIELISFHAEPVKSTVNLFWSTASETNNDYFTVERSKSGVEWKEVVTIPGAGTSKQRINYSTVDDGPYLGTSYYRLKQTDYDGKFSYSNIVRVVMQYEESLTVYPNPSHGSFTISAPFKISGDHVQMFDNLGKSFQVPVSLKDSGIEAEVDSKSLAPGMYILQVSDGFVTKSFRVVIY